MKVKNLMLDNYIDVVEVNSSINPIYCFYSHLCSYKGSESVDHLGLTKKLSLCFSTHVICNIAKISKQHKTISSRRDTIFKILKRIKALMKSCVVEEASSLNVSAVSNS